MALEFVEGFPYTHQNQLIPPWTASSYINECSIQTGGRFNGYWLRIGGGTSGDLWKNLPSNQATRMFQFGCMVYGGGAARTIFQARDNGTSQVSIYWGTDGKITVYCGGNALGTSSLEMTGSVWHQVEFKTTIDPSAGTALVKIDGIEFLNLTGKNTRNTGNSYTNQIYFPNPAGQWIGISDLIVMNTSGSYCNDLLGIRRVAVLVPTADGNYKEWSRSAGSDNYANVDEIPRNDDTDYNYSTAVNKRDTFVFPDIANTNIGVDAVCMNLYSKMAEAGSAKLKGMARSNGDDGDGSEVNLGSSYDALQSYIYVDPDTGVAFTAAGFNAAEFGYRRSA